MLFEQFFFTQGPAGSDNANQVSIAPGDVGAGVGHFVERDPMYVERKPGIVWYVLHRIRRSAPHPRIPYAIYAITGSHNESADPTALLSKQGLPLSLQC